MPVEKRSPQPDFDDISERLTEGIETCRSVIANYKSLLTRQQSVNSTDESQGKGDDSDMGMPGSD